MEAPTKRSIYGTAGIGVLAVAILAGAGLWTFNVEPPPLSFRPSLWQLLLADRATLGLARLAAAMFAGYIIVSIPVLILHNRWMTRLSPSGGAAEDITQEVAAAARTVGKLRAQVRSLEQERDDFRALVEQETRPDG